MELTLTLSDEDLAAIGHKVVDPVAWAQHAFERVGAAAVREKIAKYQEEYLAERERLGGDYKSRAQLQAEEDAAEEARLAALAAAREAQRAEEEAAGVARREAAAISLNNPVIRNTQEQRDAFALLIGVKPLTIPLDQDAVADDIQSL